MTGLYDADNPPLDVAVSICRNMLAERPLRIAFAGRAGAGKSTLAALLSGGSWPVLNHADTMKEEVLEWLVDASLRGFDPESDEAFEHFANFMGISPARIQDDLWDLLGPVYASFVALYLVSQRGRFPLHAFAGDPPGVNLPAKVEFVERHKTHFREPLQLYGQMSKELTANPYYWVDRTIARSIGSPICFNADTRFRDEMEALRGCGWTGVFLQVSDAVQRQRRPELTQRQRDHASEWGIVPDDCDVTIDADHDPAYVLMQVAAYLNAGVPA